MGRVADITKPSNTGRLRAAWHTITARHWPYGFVLVAPLILFAPFLVGRQVLYWGTPLLQFYPWRTVAAEAVRAGEWPLWNPYLGNGAPLLANYQSALLYPPNWLSLLLPLDFSLSWLAALHLTLAGAGMVTLARALGLGSFGQVVAGLGFGLSQYLVARVGFISINATVAWLPWLVWAVELICNPSGERIARARTRRSLVLAGLTALMLLAGHAQTAWYSLLLAAAWALWRLWRPVAAAAGRRDALWKAGTLVSGVALGVCLAAAQLLPTAELMRHSQRASAAALDFVLTYSFSPWRLLTALAPDMLGNPARGRFFGYGNYWEDAIYTGVLTTALAFGALLAESFAWLRSQSRADRLPRLQHNRGLPAFLALIMAASLLLALGGNTPVFPFFYRYVPTFDLFQAPARIMLGWVFAVALLAGIAADGWRSRRPSGWSLYWTRLATAGAAGMAVVALFTPDFLRLPGTAGGQLRTAANAVALAGAGLCALGVLSLLRTEARPRWWALAAAGFLCADLLYAGYGLNPGAPTDLYRRNAATAAALSPILSGGRLFQYLDDENRVKFERLLLFESFGDPNLATATRDAQLPNTALLDGFSSANNFDPLLIARYAGLLALVERNRSAGLLRLMNVTALASSQPIVGAAPIAVASRVGVAFYPLAGDSSRAWVVHRASTVASADGALAAISATDFDPVERVILEGTSISEAGSERVITAREPISLTGSHNAVTIRVSLREAGWVVLADTYFPGWTVTVDGHGAPLLIADYAFRGVAIEAGEHTVEFEYRPRIFAVGLWITGLSLVVCLFGAITLRPKGGTASERSGT